MRRRPRTPASRRPIRWFTWSVGLACLGLAALPAGAATDKIVVSEFLLRCADGSPVGAFVELVAAGPAQTFDAALGVRLLSPSGATVADLPGLFASRAGQPWPAGQHFLIATAAFEPLTGVAPDTVFASPPTTGSGSILIYRRVGTGTTIQVLRRVQYTSSSSLARTPPPGRSAFSVIPDLFRWSPDPSPTRSDGIMARAPGCFADPHRPIRITELATQCAGANPAGGFVEIAPTLDNQALDTDLALRAFDHSGATLFDVPLGFGSQAGVPWPTNRAWLVGDSLLKSTLGDRPDLVWPAPLDAVGGRLVLHGLDATGAEIVLSDVEYGTAEIPPPPAGASLVWNAFTGHYVQRSPSTPTDFTGRPHVAQSCIQPSTLRIQELLTSCSTTGAHESYVELVATGDGERRDSTLVLEIHDASDSVTAVVSAGFGASAGGPWPLYTYWLLATEGITNDRYFRADAVLPVPLDPVAGRIELLRRLGASPGRTEIIQSLRWGGPQLAPPPGQALRRVTDTNYQVVTPAPITAIGQPLRCPPPPDTTIGVPVAGMEVCTGCWDGSRRGQYVRLILVAGQLLDTSFVLRLYDRDGALLGTTPRLFAAASPRRPTESRSWLLTDPGFPAPSESIDAVLPAPLDSVAGTVQVVWVRDGTERASAKFRYGPDAHPIVPPGYCFRTVPLAGLAYPTPISFNRIANPIPGCHFSSLVGPGDPYIGEVFLACSDRDSSMQYIEVAGVNPDRAPDPRLSLRVLDRLGTLRQSLPHVLPTSIPPGPGGIGLRTVLVGGPVFEGTTGFAPDRALDRPIELAGGALELYFDDRVIGEQRTLQTLNFSAGTVPPLGRSLVISPSYGQVSSRHPIALRLDGDSFRIPAACLDTSVAVPMVLDKVALGCFDGDPRGQIIQLASSGTEDTLTTAFVLRAYDHTGALAGEVSPAFGARSGLPGGELRPLLIARADALLPVPLDAPLGFELDTLGGTIELLERRPTGERVSWSHAYPGSDPHGFIMGSVQRLVSGTAWAPGSPLLTNWSRQSGYLLGCHYGSGTQPVVNVRSVLGACGDGTLGPSYVELAVSSRQSVLAGLELRIEDDRTSMTVPLFPGARAFEAWAPGHSLLLASDAFAAAMGFPPDRRLPNAFGTGIGRISVRLADPTYSIPHELTSQQLDFASFPEPGRALERSGATLVPTGSPRPTTFDGVTHTLPPECFVQTGAPNAVRVSGAMLACADGGTRAQFVQVDRTSAIAVRAPDLRVRLLDRAGTPLGERDHLFPFGATFWGHANSLVIGGPGFHDTFGFSPDATLPAVMDIVGGTIQLVRTEAGADHVISELRYGPGGVAVPAPATSLVLDHDTWSSDTLPHPHGFGGEGTMSPLCRAHCDPQRVQLSLTASLAVTPVAGGYSDSYSEVSYDLTRAKFDVRSRFARAELLMTDRYTLTGTATPETLETFLDVLEAHGDLCSGNTCFHSARRLHLLVNGEEADSLLASVSERGRLHARVPFQPGKTTSIQVLATAYGLLNPDLRGRVAGRLGFELPRDGMRVTSCGGYDSDRARVVQAAEWSLSPHTVAIDWSVSAEPGFTADVERLDESSPLGTWVLRETRPAEPSGLLRFRDPKVRAENTYRYRLAWSDPFGSYTSDEIRIHVPRLPSFGLVGVLPNPTHGTLRVSFELPEPADVHLELFDLLGRRVREVRAPFATGMQVVALDQGSRLAPGLYQVRLAAGGRGAKLTVVVLP